MAKVLILDQSKSMRNTLRERLEFEGFSTEAAEDEEAASTMCEKIPFDVILSDRGCKIPDAGIPFIVLSAEASIDSAVEAVRNGAQDYLTKPIDMNRLLQSIHRTIDNPAPAPACAPAAAPARRSRRSRNMHTEQIIGTSPQMEHVRQLIDKVAPCEARVLITGENGTGKELVARWLHAKSSRAAAPFVEVNCAAIPSELIESELFGHEKGSFTGAVAMRRGRFEQASGGTLFLDEVGELTPELQVKLLRVLQERRFERVGGSEEIEVDIRIVAATNKDLMPLVQAGTFREDLYYRLNVVHIPIPPLRERREDIPLLVAHFAEKAAKENGIPPKTFSTEALNHLSGYEWPGNIRQLQNVVERCLVLVPGDVITLEDLPAEIRDEEAQFKSAVDLLPVQLDLADTLERIEAALIRRALVRADFVQAKAAELLGISKSLMQYKLKKYSITGH